MKVPVYLAVLAVVAVVAMLSVSAVADSVLYKNTPYCVGQDDCRSFAEWGPDAAGYVELLDSPGGPVSDYIWVDFEGFLWFESDNGTGKFGALPPAGLPLLGTLVENGQLQDVGVFFEADGTRPLFVQSELDTPARTFDSPVVRPRGLVPVRSRAAFLAGIESRKLALSLGASEGARQEAALLFSRFTIPGFRP